MKLFDDETLLARWRDDRDGDAFAELARRHAPVVFDITRRVLRERGLAEDVLQEALLDLALERTQRPAEVGVAAWLVRFAVHRARSKRVSEMRRTTRQVAYASQGPRETLPDEAVELESELQRALGSCNDEDRALLALRFLHGWEYDRIASALAMDAVAVRVRLHRILLRIRSRLARGAVMATFEARMLARLLETPVFTTAPDSLDGWIESVVKSARSPLGPIVDEVERGARRSRRRIAILAGAALLFLATVAVPSKNSSEGLASVPSGPSRVVAPSTDDPFVIARPTDPTIGRGCELLASSSVGIRLEIACASPSR